MKTELTIEQQALLDEIINEINNIAKEVVEEYKLNPAVSGSEGTVIQIHNDSPILNEDLNEDIKDEGGDETE